MVTLSQALLIALDHHQAGRVAEAEDIYRRILDADPEHADAMELLGVLAAQTGRFGAAGRLLRLAVALRPDGAGGLSNLAGVEQSAAALDSAVRLYGRALPCCPTLPTPTPAAPVPCAGWDKRRRRCSPPQRRWPWRPAMPTRWRTGPPPCCRPATRCRPSAAPAARFA
jgi:tetratricopeptide (TPR) repeat protein